MNVELVKLREITNRLFKHLEDAGYSSVKISEASYWSIPKDELYDPYNEPSELTLGVLEEDWEQLEKILNESDDPVAYAFVWLSGILRKIGEDVPC